MVSCLAILVILHPLTSIKRVVQNVPLIAPGLSIRCLFGLFVLQDQILVENKKRTCEFVMYNAYLLFF